MSGKFSMDDYIDVAERIRAFNQKYPDGSLQTVAWSIERIGDQTLLVYHAAAYRNPDDPRPGMGIASEPFPGKTTYTRDSELMNAETSAWGRAIVACGLASKKIASRQEVQARQTDDKANGNEPSVTASDIQWLKEAAKGLKVGQIKLAFAACGLPVPDPFGFDAVPKAKAAPLLDALAGMERE